MKIKVTQEHINNGKQSNCNKCPIALALLDTFGERLGPKGKVEVGGGDDIMVGGLPLTVPERERDKVDDFIHTFDEGGTVKPFSFNLTL